MSELNVDPAVLLMENSDEDHDTEFCENVLIKFKTLLNEVNLDFKKCVSLVFNKYSILLICFFNRHKFF